MSDRERRKGDSSGLRSQEASQAKETKREQELGRKEGEQGGEQEEGTAFEIGVHVADVSHFVEEGSDLDAAAAERATTVYLDAK